MCTSTPPPGASTEGGGGEGWLSETAAPAVFHISVCLYQAVRTERTALACGRVRTESSLARQDSRGTTQIPPQDQDPCGYSWQRRQGFPATRGGSVNERRPAAGAGVLCEECEWAFESTSSTDRVHGTARRPGVPRKSPRQRGAERPWGVFLRGRGAAGLAGGKIGNRVEGRVGWGGAGRGVRRVGWAGGGCARGGEVAPSPLRRASAAPGRRGWPRRGRGLSSVCLSVHSAAI